MSARRRRNKNSSTSNDEEKPFPASRKPTSPITFSDKTTQPSSNEEPSHAPPRQESIESNPAIQADSSTASKAAHVTDGELDIELDDYFEDQTTVTANQTPLPTGNETDPLITQQKPPSARVVQNLDKQILTEEEQALPKENKKPPLTNFDTTKIQSSEFDTLHDLGELDDIEYSEDSVKDSLIKEPINKADSLKKEASQTVTEEQLPEQQPQPQPQATKTPTESTQTFSLFGKLKESILSLSFLEQASIGVFTLVLAIAAIWSTSIVSAQIPSVQRTSELKFPLREPNSLTVLDELETYWRAPIREGENQDLGIPDSIALVPVVKVTLNPESKAKALRFLFKNEEDRYAGDASTLIASGGKFSSSNTKSAKVKNKQASVNSTTGFYNEGALIAYLADQKARWQIVILESKDGKEFQEFISIPISAIRND